MKAAFFIISFLCVSGFAWGEPIPKDSLYLGLDTPGDTAIIFAPGKISSTNRMVSCVAFSPDGSECYFDVFGRMHYMRYVNDRWSREMIPSFLPDSIGASAFITDDGNRLYFDKWRKRSCDIWMVERKGENWTAARELPSPVNSSSLDYCYSQTIDGTGYITSDRPGGIENSMDIWRVQEDSAHVFRIENLDLPINSPTYDFTSCIAPDGSYIIFASFRSSDYSDQDLWISFNKGKNAWTKPISMERIGANINVAPCSQHNPRLSPDGKYLFFSREIQGKSCDIYWVSTHIIEGLKKMAFEEEQERVH